MENPDSFVKRLHSAARPHLRPFDLGLYIAFAVAVVLLMYFRGDPAVSSEAWIRAVEIFVYVIVAVLGVYVWAALKMEPELEKSRRDFLGASFFGALFGGIGLGWMASPDGSKLPTSKDLSGRFVTGKTVRLVEVASPTGLVEERIFENCNIHGPAVILNVDGIQIDSCGFDIPAFAMVLDLASEEVWTVGGISLRNVRFYNCRFHRIQFGAPPSVASRLRDLFSAGSGSF